MNVFFGKISDKRNVAQIHEGYYESPRGSSWFNGLEQGDYAFVIALGKIRLWKAREWKKTDAGDQRFYFDIVDGDIGLSTREFVRLRFFKLDVNLLVKTWKMTASEKKAFFPIDVLPEFDEEMLLDKTTYHKSKNFRCVYTYSSKKEAENHADKLDLVFYFEEGSLHLCPIEHSDPLLQAQFSPRNLELIGKGRPRKDKTLATIKAQSNTNKNLAQEMSLSSIYDAIMVPYREVNQETQYWVMNGFKKDHIAYCAENDLYAMQFQYGDQKTGTVTQRLKSMAKVRPGDRVLLYTNNKYYAHAVLTEVEFEGSINTTLHQQITDHIGTQTGELITYTDAPCYFEDLTADNGFEGEFGQRLKVEVWEDFNQDGLGISGIKEHSVDGMINTTIIQLKDSSFFNLVKDKLSNMDVQENYGALFVEHQSLLKWKRQIILQGPPGTGKTYSAKNHAQYLLHKQVSPDKNTQSELLESSKNFNIVQFHPSYTYEDFVRGITAKSTGKGIEYETTNRTLIKVAVAASKDPDNDYVLIIDEINRANLPSVLGELIYALEYRGEAVKSMYEKDGNADLVLPENLYIIGTMNTADRSVGHIDYAIRRRFAFVDMLPNRDVIELDKGKELFDLVTRLFEKDTLAPDFDKDEVQIGHSYFMAKDEQELKLKLDYEILPILHEYVKDGILLDGEGTQALLTQIESFLG